MREKRNYGTPYLFLSFYVVIFNISRRLMQESDTSKKAVTVFFGHLDFFLS